MGSAATIHTRRSHASVQAIKSRQGEINRQHSDLISLLSLCFQNKESRLRTVLSSFLWTYVGSADTDRAASVFGAQELFLNVLVSLLNLLSGRFRNEKLQRKRPSAAFCPLPV
jgi:hypothetical protein